MAKKEEEKGEEGEEERSQGSGVFVTLSPHDKHLKLLKYSIPLPQWVLGIHSFPLGFQAGSLIKLVSLFVCLFISMTAVFLF